MTQIVIQVESKANFDFLLELFKQIPFIKSAKVETDNNKARLQRMENEVAKARKEYKAGKTITLKN